jgi:hypothetical protein
MLKHAIEQEEPPRVRVLSEAELAEWQSGDRRIVFRQGRYWFDHWGFFRLLHFAATMPADRVSRPSGTCWAYHVLLPDEDAQYANAWYPVHLIRNLSEFGEDALGSNARKELRRCQNTLRVIRVSDPDLLRAQGWAIFSQNARRIEMGTEVTEKAYLAGVDSLVTDTRRVILGAMDGDRLLSYIETYAVEGTAYTQATRVGDEGISRRISGFLPYEAAQFYRRSGQVEQLCAGVPVPQRMGISVFKERWGMPIVLMPARFWSPKPFRALLKAARPEAYIRAIGPPAPWTLPASPAVIAREQPRPGSLGPVGR